MTKLHKNFACVCSYTYIFPPRKNSKTFVLNHLMLNHHPLPKILRVSAYNSQLWVHASDTFIFSPVADMDSKECGHKVFHLPHTRYQPVGCLLHPEVSWLFPTEYQFICLIDALHLEIAPEEETYYGTQEQHLHSLIYSLLDIFPQEAEKNV